MLALSKKWLSDEILDNNLFLVITLVIIFIGIISKSTSWSVGGEKGIKGDSLGKYVEFHSGAKFPWDYKYYTDNPEDAIRRSEEKMREVNIEAIKNEGAK